MWSNSSPPLTTGARVQICTLSKHKKHAPALAFLTSVFAFFARIPLPGFSRYAALICMLGGALSAHCRLPTVLAQHCGQEGDIGNEQCPCFGHVSAKQAAHESADLGEVERLLDASVGDAGQEFAGGRSKGPAGHEHDL